MHYHLVLTQKCNLSCRYCGATEEPSIMPINLDYSLEKLKSFLSNDKHPVIAFYGGEPVIANGRIMQIMDEISAEAFVIQTNGTLLPRIPAEYISKFHAILISIDGGPNRTNYYRGVDTYERAMKGARYARESGFTGDLIARMTVSEDSEIFEDVQYLLNLEDPRFDHVHWQLDVMWGPDENDQWIDFNDWLENKYNPGINKLVNYWIEHMENNNSIPGIVPFVAIMHTLLTENHVGLRCGAGQDFFSITTDGRVTFCPILPSVEFAVIGDIVKNQPQDLVGKVTLDEPCISCEVAHICGGRCLYTNKTKYWGEDGFDKVCQATKHLIAELQNILPRVKKLITDNKFKIEDFNYPDIENGVEIIP